MQASLVPRRPHVDVRSLVVRRLAPDNLIQRDQGGSGLGTHITYNLVRQTLGGSIQVSSEPGHGLSYYIRFPKNLKRNS